MSAFIGIPFALIDQHQVNRAWSIGPPSHLPPPKEFIMKRFVAVVAVVAAMFVFTTQESQAQFYRGGSGISIGFGSGGFGGFNPGFGGFNPGFGGINRGFGGFGGGFGHPLYGGGFNRGFGGSGLSVGYSSFRPSYGRSYYRPTYGRSFYGGGGYSRGRNCGGW